MDKLQLTGQNLGRVFNSRSGPMCAMHLCCYEAKWCSLKLKTRAKQLLVPFPLAFGHGQTLANTTTPGPSFQLQMWVCIHVDKYVHIIKTA